tara:strand:- start:2989 stop:3240 length:252 start_codon:yes stop_codon:yes gene_type:complete
MNTVEINSKFIEDREIAIDNLCGDIISLNETFQDISLLVKEQDQAINLISDNIESSQIFSEKANRELNKIDKRQRKNKWCCCC